MGRRFLNPVRLRRTRRRKTENRGAEFVLVKQILPSLFSVFSPTGSNRALYGLRNRLPIPCGLHPSLTLSQVHPICT